MPAMPVQYGIPKDNPFADTGVVLPSDQASEMAQDGSYHPGRPARDLQLGFAQSRGSSTSIPRSGELYLADVGQNAWEEVDVFPANQPCGWNLGWDHNEGASCYPAGLEMQPGGSAANRDLQPQSAAIAR